MKNLFVDAMCFDFLMTNLDQLRTEIFDQLVLDFDFDLDSQNHKISFAVIAEIDKHDFDIDREIDCEIDKK